MKLFKKYSKLLMIGSFLTGSTPTEYTFSFSTGYDSNVMRFSDKEFDQASFVPELMGNTNTYDSYVLKIGVKAKKTILKLKKKELIINSNFNLSDYRNNDDKKYWSGGVDLIYKWGSYKNIKYSLRHLDSYYLRQYLNKDISPTLYSSCSFTDRNQSLSLTYKIKKREWSVISFGFLQRYYDKPFIEFDLDILYIRAKQNYKIKNFGLIGFQFETGRAVSKSNKPPIRPSSFDRSYTTSEYYIPLTITKNIPLLNEMGLSFRNEIRKYDAEDFNDPLHSGRSHKDSKYDLWFKKKLSDDLLIKLSIRYRKRSTDSSYSWVTNLKSFNQLQTWFSIEWNIDYDRY